MSDHFHLTLTRALLASLELRRILYVLLTGVTAGDGLNFNRAFLLLVDEGGRALHGELAIGPPNDTEAYRIWREMAVQEFTLERVLAHFDDWDQSPSALSLSREIRRVFLLLPLAKNADAKHPFLDYVAGALDGQRPEAFNDRTLAVPGTAITLRQFALAPLRVENRMIGVLLVDNVYNNRPILPEELDELAVLANLAAIAVERARLHERVRRMAEQDGLTSLLNRRCFDTLLKQVFSESRTRANPLSLLLLDLDNFKAINDLSGHLAGDDVLRGVASILQQRLRVTDLAFRYGGDELAVLLPRSDGPAALEVAEFLRQAIAATCFGDLADVRTTVSVGAATIDAGHVNAEALLNDADDALYAAKRGGRNRAVLHTQGNAPRRLGDRLCSLLKPLGHLTGSVKPFDTDEGAA